MKIYILTIVLSFFSINIITAQEKTKDSLFLKLDGKYLLESKYDSNQYLIKDNDNASEGAIYLKEYKIIKSGKPKKVLCFKKFAESSKLYRVNNKKLLSELKMIELFNNYVVVLVDKKNGITNYIEVKPLYVIE